MANDYQYIDKEGLAEAWAQIKTLVQKKLTATGASNKGIYVSADGVVSACTYAVNKDVPSDAKFTDTTYSDFTGASSSAAGVHGLVPAPAKGLQNNFLRADGTWQVPANDTYSAGDGISINASNKIAVKLGTGLTMNNTSKVIDHSNAVTEVTTAGLYKVKYDAQGHITGTTAIAKSDITGLGIPGSDTNTTYTLTQDTTDGHKLTFTPSSGTATTITIPDNNDNTWRPLLVKGSTWKTGATTSGSLNFVAGGGIGLSTEGNDLTIAVAKDGSLTVNSSTGQLSVVSAPKVADNTYSYTAANIATIASHASEGATAYSWGNHANAGYLTSIPGASGSVLGGIKTAYSASGKNYAVKVDGSYNAYVNVPWTDNNTTYSAGTGLSLSGTAFSVSYGTAAGTACQGNDSRLSDSRKASDVYSWAKASTKPSYSFSEISSRGEEYLTWGGTHLKGSVSPIGMSLSQEHSANRLAFINGAALSFEYSSDGGSTWTDYGLTAAAKSQFCTLSYGIPVGRASSSTEYTTSSKTRITLTAQNGTTGYVYTDPKKLLINISSSGGMTVLIEYRSGTAYKNDSSWTTFGTYAISGWSGWNDIPLILGTLGGGTSQTSNNWQLRLTFSMTSKSTTYPTTASISCIRLFGSNSWTATSNLGTTGHLYSYDISQNATFPAMVTAASFSGSLSGNASTATKFASSQTVALTGDVTGSVSSQAGWSIATAIGSGKVTNAMLAGSIANSKLANSKMTIAGTDVSLGGSITAATIGNALTSSAPAAYATTAGLATVAAALNVNGGSATQPVYFNNGVPTACTYSLNKTVPSDAKFTDTVYTLPQASASVLGGIKTGYTASGKNYPVVLDSSYNAYVNVPWTDTTYSSKAAASGGTDESLVTTGEKYTWNSKQAAISDLSTIRSNASNGNTAYGWGNHASAGYLTSIPGASGSVLGGIKTAYTASGKNYPVVLDSSYNAYVNVPWTDNNTTYSAGTGISLSGTTFSNSGVRSTTINGNNLRVNTNGTIADLTIPFATNATTATKLGSSTVGAANKPIYLNSGTATACTGFKANMISGGFNYVGNSSNFVGMMPAMNFNAYAIERGAVGHVYLDGVELVQTSTTHMKSLFNGLSSCDWTPFDMTQQSTYTTYNSSKSYSVGELCSYFPSGATKEMWYRCIVACSNIVPTNTTYWEDVSASGTYRGVNPSKFTSLTFLITNLPICIWHENGLVLYWRVALQRPNYVTVEKGDTAGNFYTVVTNYNLEGPADTIYLGSATSTGTQSSIRLTFTGFTSTTYWNFALSQIAFTGIGGSLEGAVLFKGGGTMYGGIVPNANNTLNLGSSSYKWANVYANSFIGALTGNASTATKFASSQTVALTGDVTGSVSSQAGWSIATTIGSGKVTNAMLAGSIANSKLANSKMTIAGTDVSLGGSISAATIGNALTSSAPAAYATTAGLATVAAALNVNGGSAIQPVYFSNGVPIVCTGVAKKFIQEYAAGDLADGSYTLTHGLATSYPFLVIHIATSSSTVWQPFTLNSSSTHIRFTVTNSNTVTLDVSGVSNYKVRIMVLG